MRGIILFFISFLFLQNSFATVPTAAITFDTDVEIMNATSSRERKIRQTEELIKEVIATEEFRNAVLNHSYNGRKTFVDNGGLSNLSIYNKILEGAEVLSRTKDNTMDLVVKTYYESSNTVGYTFTNSKIINMNTKFLDRYTPAQVSRNMMHEWLHKLGFKHAVSYSRSRDYSVPYGIGSIMERLAAKVGTTTRASSTTSLAAPTNLSLSKTSTQVTLKWSAASGAKEYKVYRQLSGSSSIYLQRRTTSLSFTQTKPTRNAIYYVRSVDSSGNTAKSVEVKFSATTSTLSAPTNLTLSEGSSSVTLRWSAASGAKEYKIYRKLSGSSSIYLQKRTTSLSFTQAKPSRDAIYYVRSVDSSGRTAKSNEVKFYD